MMRNQTETEDQWFELGLALLSLAGIILGFYLVLLVLMLSRAVCLWLYCKYYLRRPIAFDLCPSDPWCFKDDFEELERANFDGRWQRA